MITLAKLDLRKDLGTSQLVKEVIDSRQRITVLHHYPVQFSVVDATQGDMLGWYNPYPLALGVESSIPSTPLVPFNMVVRR